MTFNEALAAAGPVAQAIWESAFQRYPSLPLPTIGQDEDDHWYMAWTGKPTFEVQLEPDGRIEWFYTDHEGESACNEDEPEPYLPEEAYLLLGKVVKP